MKLDDSPNTNKRFVACIGNVESKSELMAAIATSLCFPDYFGRNWDALDECLNDLSWITEPEVVLVHDRYPKIGQKDFDTYLEILCSVAENWKTEGVRKFTFKFPAPE